jgi:UDP-N-acetylglucosamine acyltransferase
MGGADIHPSAIVDPRAELGAGVRIGAFSIVGPEVVLGADVEIGHHVVLEGRVVMGRGARVGHGSLVGGVPQDLKFKADTPSGVRLGAGAVIREYVTVHRATRPDGWTEIGEGCLVMAMSHVAHDCRLEPGVILINYAGVTGHCELGERATIGGMSGVVPFTRVGALAYVGGHSKVTADLPPYMIAEGSPATVRSVNVIGMRRAGIGPRDRRLVQDAHRLLYRSGLPPRSALERIQSDLPATPPLERLIEFITASRRGICGPPREATPEGGAEPLPVGRDDHDDDG